MLEIIFMYKPEHRLFNKNLYFCDKNSIEVCDRQIANLFDVCKLTVE